VATTKTIPENWEESEVYYFEIVNETTLYVWWDGEENNESIQKYLTYDNKLYLGDDYKSFHKQ
jgi:hypothetical protein